MSPFVDWWKFRPPKQKRKRYKYRVKKQWVELNVFHFTLPDYEYGSIAVSLKSLRKMIAHIKEDPKEGYAGWGIIFAHSVPRDSK